MFKQVLLTILTMITLTSCATFSKQNNIYHLSNQYYFSPHLLPNVEPTMLFSGFWIDQCDNPDDILLTINQINALNKHIVEKKYVRNLDALVSRDSLRKFNIDQSFAQLNKKKIFIKNATLYEKDGSRITEAEVQKYISNFPKDLKEFNDLTINKFAIFTKFSDERMIPTDKFLSQKPFDDEFNYMQNNGLDAGEKTFLVCFNRDKSMVYQHNCYSSGWVPIENLLFVNDFTFLDQYKQGWISSPYAQLWKSDQKLGFSGLQRMGNIVYIDTTYVSDTLFKILNFDTIDPSFFFVDKRNVLLQPRLMTSRNVLNDIFKWIHYPYGWGDTNQFVDCSKMIQCLYALYGIRLPRNGAAQGAVWDNLLTKDLDGSHIKMDLDRKQKREFIAENSIPGMTLLRFPGHIMLYIGNYKGRNYAIHTLYRYQQVDYKILTNRVTNRIVVSDLSLGKGMAGITFLDRISFLVNPGISTNIITD